jgi:hypothetical protein
VIRRGACSALCALALCGAVRRAHAQGVGGSPVGVQPMQVEQTVKLRPDLEPLRLGGEIVVGTYAGIGGFVLGRAAGGVLADLMTHDDGTRDRIAMTTGIIGGGLATAGGVYAIGNICCTTGSFGATFLGAGAGALASYVLQQTVFSGRSHASRDASDLRWSTAILEAFLPSIGATIGFNSSRRIK